MGWRWAGRGAQGRIPSTHNSTFLSTWHCQSTRSPYRICSHAHNPPPPPPPPHTFPSSPVSSPLCQLPFSPTQGPPWGEVSAHITLGHIGPSHSLTLHLQPLWNVMTHMFDHTCYLGFSHERTHKSPTFIMEAAKFLHLVCNVTLLAKRRAFTGWSITSQSIK